ncbi:MAG: NAD-dependent epimerase/dehydratase family protein [Alphaproteobacteria bacterium]
MPGTVALTGGTGFIGAHVAAWLMDAGRIVRLLVRRPPVHPLLAGRPFEVVIGGLGDRRALDALVDGAESLVHVAGAVRAASRSAFYAANAGPAGAIAEAARKAGIRRAILISSLAAREPGLSDYAASKRAGEDAFARSIGEVPWLALRPTAVYGPWDTATFAIFKAVRFGLAPVAWDRDARLSFVHVADLATAVEASLEGDETGVREVDDGSDEGYRWADVIEAAAAAVGRPAVTLRIPDRVFRLAGHGAGFIGRAPILSAGKVSEMLHGDWRCRDRLDAGWRPRLRIREGFVDTVAWYRRAGWLGPESGRIRG